MSHYGPSSRARRGGLPHAARARLPQGDRGQRLGARARRGRVRHHAVQLRLRARWSRRHLRARLRRAAASSARPEGVDRGGHARGRLRSARRRERHHPHAPGVRERARAGGAADPGAVRRAGALPRPLGRDHPVRARRGRRFLKKNVAKKITSGANAFILANHGVLVLGGDAERAVLQHGAAREGRARLPAGADHRRARGEGAAADPRDRLRQAARRREEARGAGRGGKAAREAAALRARGGRAAEAAEQARAAAGEPAPSGARDGRRGSAGRPLRRPARRLRDQRLPGRRRPSTSG